MATYKTVMAAYKTVMAAYKTVISTTTFDFVVESSEEQERADMDFGIVF